MPAARAFPGLVRAEFEYELAAIAGWWRTHGLDPRGGVHGEVSDDNTPRPAADKGAVLHARALWFFSALAKAAPNSGAEPVARTLYAHFVSTFLDNHHGGVFWAARADGACASDRKQVYAQAFAIYAFCAYAESFGDGAAAARAAELAGLLEERAFDREKGGYIEALARDWSRIEDMRLSERDLNAPKTMNTHLHVLEAYTSLARTLGDAASRALLEKIVDLFIERFCDPRPAHLTLLYSWNWESLVDHESYGHDIETSWLLIEAAEALGDAGRAERAERVARALFESAYGRIDQHGALAFERDDGGLVAERHWWAQAEALVGFYNAFQVTGETRYAEAAAGVWAFLKDAQIDRANGEWLWLSTADAPAKGPYKTGFWKGPYHNGRAMMEMMRRLGSAAA